MIITNQLDTLKKEILDISLQPNDFLAYLMTQTKSERFVVGNIAFNLQKQPEYDVCVEVSVGKKQIDMVVYEKSTEDEIAACECKLFYTFNVFDRFVNDYHSFSINNQKSNDADIDKLRELRPQTSKLFILFLSHYDVCGIPSKFAYSGYHNPLEKQYSDISDVWNLARESLLQILKNYDVDAIVDGKRDYGRHKEIPIGLITGIAEIT